MKRGRHPDDRTSHAAYNAAMSETPQPADPSDSQAGPSCTPGRPCCPASSPRALIIMGLLALAVVYLYATRSRPASFTWAEGLDAGLAEAAAKNRLILVSFSMDGCSGCQWMEREVFANPKAAEALANWVPVHIDGNSRENAALLDRYGITALPAFAVLSPRGEFIGRFDGPVDLDDFTKVLKTVEEKWTEGTLTTAPESSAG